MLHSQNLNRRQFSSALLAGGMVVHSAAFSKDSALPVPASLAQAGCAAADQGEPLVLLVSLPGCPFCERVRRNYLLPLRAQGLPAWQISVNDTNQRLLDFNAQPATSAALASVWQVRVTPTVLLFDARGVEVAERLVGFNSADFYGAYLDAALASARGRIH